jgi:hypothetical protein
MECSNEFWPISLAPETSPALSPPKLQPLKKSVAAMVATPRIRQIKADILIRYSRVQNQFSTLHPLVHPNSCKPNQHRWLTRPGPAGEELAYLLQIAEEEIAPAAQLFLAFARSISK